MEQQPPLLLSFVDFTENGPAEVIPDGILVRSWFLSRKGYTDAPDVIETPLGPYTWQGERPESNVHLYVPQGR